MSEFNKDDYLNDLPDADNLSATGQAGPSDGAAAGSAGKASDSAKSADASADKGAAGPAGDKASAEAGPSDKTGDSAAAGADDGAAADDSLTPLGKAKKEAADYLEALQRERAEFVNYRNRAQREQERFRQHGIIDVLTALLPALDDIDRIREHSEMDDSFKAVAAKIDKAFEKFGVEKFGEKGEEFDPTKHEAILHKPDAEAEKETVDTVVEAGYRIGGRPLGSNRGPRRSSPPAKLTPPPKRSLRKSGYPQISANHLSHLAVTAASVRYHTRAKHAPDSEMRRKSLHLTSAERAGMLSDRKPRPERPGAKSDNMPVSSARSTVSAPPQASATPSDKTPHGRALAAGTITSPSSPLRSQQTCRPPR